jgi:uncharacterized protein
MGVANVVLKLASRCNLNCSYCYIYQHEDRSYLRRPKLIGDEVYERTLAAMLDYCEARSDDHAMALTYHGGEPTMVGAERFDRLAARAREVLGRRLRLLAMQTNGVLLDGEWVEVLRRHQVRVSVSLDGPPEIHDAVRVDHHGRGSYAATVAGIKLLIEGGIVPKVLSVVNPGFAGDEAYRHFRSLGIRSMDFLLPDITHDSKESFYGGRGPTPVADYLIPAFDAWLDEDDPQVEVRLFSNLLRGFLGDEPGSDAFGNPAMSYLIVDTDGAIEALDALRVCEEGIAASGLNVLRQGFGDLAAGLPLVHRAVHEGFELPQGCRGCPEREVCGGGHLPHRYSRARGFDNPSAWCADILKLFAHIRERAGISAPPRAGGGA